MRAVGNPALNPDLSFIEDIQLAIDIFESGNGDSRTYTDPKTKVKKLKFGFLPDDKVTELINAGKNHGQDNFTINGEINKAAMAYTINFYGKVKKLLEGLGCEYLRHEADSRTAIPHATAHFIAVPPASIVLLKERVNRALNPEEADGAEAANAAPAP